MKIAKVLTVAVAAALIPFAAFAEKPEQSSTRTELLDTQKKAEKKDDCPFVFGCSDKWKAEKAAEEKPVAKSAAAQPKKSERKAVRSKRTAPKLDETVTGSIETLPIGVAKAEALSERPGARPYAAIVAKYAAEYGVPVPLAQAVIKIESNYRANARGSAGEIGLMQIKPATARMMGYTGSAAGLFDPDTNIRYGLKYLSMAQQLGGGDTCGTILRYNAGHAATRMNKRSSNYCAQVKLEMVGA